MHKQWTNGSDTWNAKPRPSSEKGRPSHVSSAKENARLSLGTARELTWRREKVALAVWTPTNHPPSQPSLSPQCTVSSLSQPCRMRLSLEASPKRDGAFFWPDSLVQRTLLGDSKGLATAAPTAHLANSPLAFRWLHPPTSPRCRGVLCHALMPGVQRNFGYTNIDDIITAPAPHSQIDATACQQGCTPDYCEYAVLGRLISWIRDMGTSLDRQPEQVLMSAQGCSALVVLEPPK